MYHNLSWDELKEKAREALEGKQAESLKGLDDALHMRFFNEVDHGDQKSRLAFQLGVLSLLETEEARAIPPPSEAQRVAGRWEHLDELMEVFRKPAVDLAEAGRFLKSREHGLRLLEIVAAAGSTGIASGELAERLGITRQQLSSSLADFEEMGIIERIKEGKRVFVSLGLRGQLLAGDREPRPQPGPSQERKPVPLNCRVLEFVRKPREKMVAA